MHNRQRHIMTESSPPWVAHIQAEKNGSNDDESSPLFGLRSRSEENTISLGNAPAVYAGVLSAYLIIISFLSDGQQHMDFGLSIQVWAAFATMSQIISTVFCAYTWGRLRGNITCELKTEILLLTTAATVFLFKMSLDIYFILEYDRLYDTQSTVIDTFAQRQFDSLFDLINISTVTLLPYASYLFIMNLPGDGKPKPTVPATKMAQQ